MSDIVRSAEWGHWGITFVSWSGDVRPYLVNIHGIKHFPCGNAGPCDGYVGSQERERYKAMVKAWQEDGILPVGIDRKHANV